MRHPTTHWLVFGIVMFFCTAGWGSDVPYSVEKASIPVPVLSGTLGSPATAEAPAPEPYVYPLRGRKIEIVSGFGKREVQIPVKSTGTVPGSFQRKTEFHEGIDFAVSPGTPVLAARSGKVLFAGFSKMYVSRVDKNEQHRFVIIRHADGQSSRYVHLNGLRVRPGQDVVSGQILGVSAESDEWTKPVLHFEIRTVQGQAMDPKPLLQEPKTP